MLPWKLRKRHILPVNQNLSSAYFSPAKFQLMHCTLSLAMIWQMTNTHKLPKLCLAIIWMKAGQHYHKWPTLLNTSSNPLNTFLTPSNSLFSYSPWSLFPLFPCSAVPCSFAPLFPVQFVPLFPMSPLSPCSLVTLLPLFSLFPFSPCSSTGSPFPPVPPPVPLVPLFQSSSISI